MKYFRGMRTLPLILRANGTRILKWWVDAAFTVHPNMQGHIGGGLSLGRGFPIMSSTKQKLNTQSSMESEIVGADSFMPAICWTRYFIMEAQGYQVQDNILFVPGQQECNSFGKEWKSFKQQVYEAHQYLVFLYFRSH
jgi:hypothetical protein